MKNPFPGMNPWLEEYWRDVHASLLVYACDILNRVLPADLRARTDERLVIDLWPEKPRVYVPDVAITESWDNSTEPVLGTGFLLVKVAEPVVVDLGEVKLRRLEIVDSHEHVITVLKALLPSNKDDPDHRNYWNRKRSEHLRLA